MPSVFSKLFTKLVHRSHLGWTRSLRIEPLESRYLLATMPPAFLFDIQAGVQEYAGFVTTTTLQSDYFGNERAFHLTEGTSWDSGNTDFILDLTPFGEWTSDMRASFDASSNDSSATLNLEQHLKFDANLISGSPFFANRFDASVTANIYVRANPIDMPHTSIPIVWTIDADNTSPENTWYNFQVHRPGTTTSYDIQHGLSITSDPIDANFFPVTIVHEGYRYNMAASVVSRMFDMLALTSHIPPSGYQWHRDANRKLNLTVTRLDVEVPPPELTSVAVLPAFDVTPQTLSDGKSVANALTTGKPAVIEAVVSGSNETMERYDINLHAVVDYAAQIPSWESIGDFKLVNTQPDHTGAGIQSVYHAPFVPVPGLHGPGNMAIVYAQYQDKITNERTNDFQSETFDLLFVKMGTDPQAGYGLIDKTNNQFLPTNWFRYWAQSHDAAASHPGQRGFLDNIMYRYGGKGKHNQDFGVTIVAGVDNDLTIVLFDPAATFRATEPWKETVFGDLSPKLPQYPSDGITGVDWLEHVLAHERAHAWLTATYGRHVNLFGYCFRGFFADSDCDGLPNQLEAQEALQRFGFKADNPTSFAGIKLDSAKHKEGTDEEAFATLVAHGKLDLKLLKTPNREQDFANPGTKTSPEFFRVSDHSGLNAAITSVELLPIDKDTGLLAEAMTIAVGVRVDDAGSYALGLEFETPIGTPIFAWQDFAPGAGDHTIQVELSGPYLHFHKLEGSLVLREVRLSGQAEVDVWYPDIVSQHFHFSEFVSRGQAVIDSIEFTGVSSNSYDAGPSVDFRVTFDPANEHVDHVNVEGYLWTDSGKVVGHATSVLEPGKYDVLLEFDANNARAHGAEGHFVLRGVYALSDGEIIDQSQEAIRTPWLSKEELNSVVTLTDVLVTLESDTIGNEERIIEIEAAATLGALVNGNYRVVATLSSSTEILGQASTEILEVSGEHDVVLSFGFDAANQVNDVRDRIDIWMRVFDEAGTLVLASPNYGDVGRFQLSLFAPNPWHNYVMPGDVNGDGRVTPFDVLLVVSELVSMSHIDPQTGVLPTLGAMRHPPLAHFDVTNDGRVSPFDALTIVSILYVQKGEGHGEGEAIGEPGGWFDIKLLGTLDKSASAVTTWLSLLGHDNRPEFGYHLSGEPRLENVNEIDGGDNLGYARLSAAGWDSTQYRESDNRRQRSTFWKLEELEEVLDAIVPQRQVVGGSCFKPLRCESRQ